MKKNIPIILTALCALSLYSTAHAQDHGHVNAGATGSTLIIDNYNDFIGHSVDLTYVPLDYNYPGTGTNLTKFIGLYQGNVTFTALAATPANAGPEANHPALGSYIHLQLVSVDGPAGGSFSFWESGAPTATFSMASGAEDGTDLWRISNNNGVAGSDPFGHVHGRRFSATLEGIYTVGFQLVDLSTNGVAGAPIYENPSQVYTFTFTAVPEPSIATLCLTALGTGVILKWRRRKAVA